MAEDPTIGNPHVTFQHDGFSISSTDGAEDEVKAQLDANDHPEKGDKVKEAASELGKRGAAAAAEKRATEKPEPDEEEEPEPKAAKTLKPIKDKEPATTQQRTEKEDEDKGRKAGSGKDLRERVKETTRENAELKRRLAQAEAVRQAPSPSPRPAERAPQAQVEPQKPRPGDFQTAEEYLDARDKYNRESWEKQAREQQRLRDAEQAANEAVRQFKETADSYKAKIEAAEKEDEDFQDRISPEVRALNIDPIVTGQGAVRAEHVVALEIIRSDQTAGFMLYFSEHPEELQRLAKLPNYQAVIREMAKIEAHLDSPTSGATTGAARAEEHSRAKPPVTPVTGSPHTPDPYAVDDDTSFDEHMRRMNAKDKRARPRLASLR